MASEVDICNLALGQIGDDATVSSINPPEGSAQAEHCQRFYPVARDVTLEAHEWGCATVRQNLALLTDTPPPGWRFVYAQPAQCANIVKLIDPANPAFNPLPERGFHYMEVIGVQPEVPYELESRADGTGVIYTNLENAQIQFVRYITDTTKFSAQLVDAISRLLASYLAGPVIKGEDGIAVSKSKYAEFLNSLAVAKGNDANNRRRSKAQSQMTADWIANR